jgi:hybrid cluster-associated redox disulfide protein
MKVTKDMTVEEVVKSNPKAAEMLMTYHVGYIGCPSSHNQTIEEIAEERKISVDDLVEALNS